MHRDEGEEPVEEGRVQPGADLLRQRETRPELARSRTSSSVRTNGTRARLAESKGAGGLRSAIPPSLRCLRLVQRPGWLTSRNPTPDLPPVRADHQDTGRVNAAGALSDERAQLRVADSQAQAG